MIDRKRTVCFTGHRKIPAEDIKSIEKQLDRIIKKLYRKGVIFYGAGGSYGFDMLAEKAVIRARNGIMRSNLYLFCPAKIRKNTGLKITKRRLLKLKIRRIKLCIHLKFTPKIVCISAIVIL